MHTLLLFGAAPASAVLATYPVITISGLGISYTGPAVVTIQ